MKHLLSPLAAFSAIVASVYGQDNIPIYIPSTGVIDYESPRISFNNLNGSPVNGELSVNFNFLNKEFVRIFSTTQSLFGCFLMLQTSEDSFPGFLHDDSGYVTDINGNPIPGYGVTGTASSSDGRFILGFYPLCLDPTGALNPAVTRPLDFYGVHFDLNFPSSDYSDTITDAQFFLNGYQFGIGPNLPTDIAEPPVIGFVILGGLLVTRKLFA